MRREQVRQDSIKTEKSFDLFKNKMFKINKKENIK